MMLITGPRQGEMSEQLKFSILAQNDAPVVVFGTGSACNFILDMLQWCTKNAESNVSQMQMPVSINYSTRDPHLFKWVKRAVYNLVHEYKNTQQLSNGGDKKDFHITLSFTGPQEEEDCMEEAQWSDKSITLHKFRLDLDSLIPTKSTVFCQGSAGFKHAVEKVSKEKGSYFYGGRGGAVE